VSARARSTTKRLKVGPLRGRSRRASEVARPGSGSTQRSVARASHRRKAHRIVSSSLSLHGRGGERGLGSNDRRRSRLQRRRVPTSERQACQRLDRTKQPRRTPGVRACGPAEAGDDVVKRRVPRSIAPPGSPPRTKDRTRATSAGAGRQVGWVAEVGRTYRDLHRQISARSKPRGR
jgi:hypothetical protein